MLVLATCRADERPSAERIRRLRRHGDERNAGSWRERTGARTAGPSDDGVCLLERSVFADSNVEPASARHSPLSNDQLGGQPGMS
jgi:hypothetical protein